MLIIAGQLADEIQGIGGGIEQMARTYGITEDQNTADVQRIQVGEGRIALLINHAGGMPPPPDTPLSLPGLRAPGLTPNPRPNAAPSPAAPSTEAPPAAVRASAASPSSATGLASSPVPSPQPGADPTAWHRADAFSLLGPWPSGDPGRMEEAADCWDSLTAALDTAWTGLQRYTAYIMADAQGPAADAFRDYADGLTATGHGSLTRAIEASQYLHDACLRQAEEIRGLKRSIEELAIQLAAAFVVGQVLSVLTFETTQGLSIALDEGMAGYLTGMVRVFAGQGAQLGERLTAEVAAVSKVLSKAGASGAQAVLIGAAGLDVSNEIDKAFGQPPTLDDLFQGVSGRRPPVSA